MKKAFAILALGLGFLSACGTDQDLGQEQEQGQSETLSLTGGFNGGPCGFYGKNLNSSNFYCANIRAGVTSNVLFELQGLQPNHVTLIRSALDIAIKRYNDYWDEVRANPSATPKLLQCTINGTKKDQKPVNSKLADSFKTQHQLFTWAPVSLGFGFQFHHKNAVTAIIRGFDVGQTAKQKEENSYTVGQAALGNDDLNGANMNIEVNRLSISLFSAEQLAGTLVHEWLHRRGYVHTGADANNPNGYVNGHSLINELDECIVTNNNPAAGASLTGGNRPKIGGG